MPIGGEVGRSDAGACWWIWGTDLCDRDRFEGMRRGVFREFFSALLFLFEDNWESIEDRDASKIGLVKEVECAPGVGRWSPEKSLAVIAPSWTPPRREWRSTSMALLT